MSTLSAIQDVFYSGSHAFNGLQEPVREIAFLVDEGYLTFDMIRIATKHEYLNIADEISSDMHASYGAAGGGNAHVGLKILVANYLKNHRGQKAKFEQAFCGYYPDVLTENKLIVAECGHTQNPDKMFDYFRFGKIQECIQIPYPDVDSDLVLGYSFTAQATIFFEFLEFLANKRRNKIKELFLKRSEKDT